MESVSVDLKDMQKTISEERDREERRNNIILYRVEESEADTAEERSKKDLEFCLQLFKEGLRNDANEEDIKKVFRLGKRDGKTRPLMIHLRDRHIKNLIIPSCSICQNNWLAKPEPAFGQAYGLQELGSLCVCVEGAVPSCGGHNISMPPQCSR
jgi:hypothetical protein